MQHSDVTWPFAKSDNSHMLNNTLDAITDTGKVSYLKRTRLPKRMKLTWTSDCTMMGAISPLQCLSIAKLSIASLGTTLTANFLAMGTCQQEMRKGAKAFHNWICSLRYIRNLLLKVTITCELSSTDMSTTSAVNSSTPFSSMASCCSGSTFSDYK